MDKIRLAAQRALEERNLQEAIRVFFDRHWDTPPEPDWTPESRVYILLDGSTACGLLELIVRSADRRILSAEQTRELTKAFNGLKRRNPRALPWGEMLQKFNQNFRSR